MTNFEALLYGLVQGVTEYLPVSSSAHLILLPKFLGEKDPGLVFDVFLHLGTLFATLIYFWRDWWALLDRKVFLRSVSDPFGNHTGVTVSMLAIATVPAVIAGLALHRLIDSVFRGEGIIVVTLAIGGVMLFLSDHLAAKGVSLAHRGDRRLAETTW